MLGFMTQTCSRHIVRWERNLNKGKLPIILIQLLPLMEKTCKDYILEIAYELDKGWESITPSFLIYWFSSFR